MNQAVQTVLAAYQIGATQQQRAAAVQLFEQLKTGDVRQSAAAGAELTQPSQPVEAQAMGYAVLQHLVGNRWDDFSQEDRTQLAGMAYNLLRQSTQDGASWVVRSKAALLLALVMKRSGPQFLEASVGQLLPLGLEGPAVQEVVCLVLRYIADEVVLLPEDDLYGEQLRVLMSSLTKLLMPVLQFLERTLEANFAALQPGGGGGREASAAIHSALGAAATYSEWAPVGQVRDSGIVAACGYMLSTAEFRDAAGAVLRHVAGRKYSTEEPAEGFNAAQAQVAEALSAAAAKLLAPGAAGELDFEGSNEEFGQLVCETMATLGASHLAAAVPSAEARMQYLQHMLAFAKHPYLPLADKALVLWLKLLQDAATAAAAAAGNVAAGKAPPPSLLPPEAVVALMELAAEQLQQRGPRVPQEADEPPPYFDSFEDYKEFMIGYRFKLTGIAKFAAMVLPEQALAAAGNRLTAAVAAAGAAAGAPGGVEQARVLLESAVMFLESTLRAAWEAPAGQDQASRTAAMVAAAEPMLSSMLALQVSDAMLLQHQARGLEAFGKLLAVRRDLVPGVVARLFELLVGCVPLEAGGHVAPPGKPLPGWREGLQARSAVSMVLLTYARACPEAFLPHLEGIAARSSELWERGMLRPGERNAISEGILAASLAGPEALQVSVAEWVLAPVRAVWASAEWQAHLVSPEAFIAHYMPVQVDASAASGGSGGGVQIVGSAGRWALYHHVHLVERAVRRMPGAGSPGSHPLAPHMAWALPSLLRLIANLNAVHSPAGRAALGPAAAALEMAPQERAGYLRHGPGVKRLLGSDEEETGDYSTVGGTTIGSLRAWLRHSREFTHHTVGMLPSCVPPTLDLAEAQAAFAPAILAYSDSLEHRNIRLVLRHITIPHIKTLPARHLVGWALPSLALLLPQLQARLAAAWRDLVPVAEPGPSTEDSIAANEEIIRDKMVRELTQEFADLLKEVAGRPLEDPGPLGSAPPAPPGSSKAPKGPTLLELLLEREPAAGIAAATAAVEGMQRRDESGFRFAMFCKALTALAPRDAQLYAYVGTEVLRAAVTSLALESMATHQADILGLIRAVLAQQLGDPSSAVHGVLQSLPGMAPEREAAFGKGFLATGSEKEQRNAIKRMLVEACGRSSFAALADWRPPTAPPLGAAKPRVVHAGSTRPAGGSAEEEKLQGDITRALFA